MNAKSLSSGYVRLLALGAIVGAAGLPARGQTNFDDVNRFSFGPRAAFGIKARFKNIGNLTLNPTARTTPDGAAYNYDNGYVYPDSSGPNSGQTWYWGCDNSSQIAGNTIQMSRSTTMANASAEASSDFPDGSLGLELAYDRMLGSLGSVRYGFEAAGSYMNISLRDDSTVTADISQTTDAYAFAPGTTPPAAPPAYQGTFNGPGFLIGSTPASSTTTVVPGGATITGRRKFDANLFGLRLGPFVEFPVDDRVKISVSGGLNIAMMSASSSWAETVVIMGGGTASGAGKGSDLTLLPGGYFGANLEWEVSKSWNFQAGAQYQYLGNYSHNFGGREVDLDLSHAISVALGMTWKF